MSSDFTARLYDSLHAHESRYRRGVAYPVHKRLRFPEASMTDIYDWIAANVAVPTDGAILDAGCGVGFGTLRLAEHTGATATGISVSAKEIDAARAAAANSNVQHRVSFEHMTFDDVPQRAFDLIVAVESLKHSLDLQMSLAALAAALRPGGRLVIVEDCYIGDVESSDARKLRELWGLQALYSAEEFATLPVPGSCTAIDLTEYMPAAGLFSRLRSALTSLYLGLTRGAMADETRMAFAGGVCLQKLYAARQMRYKALLITVQDRRGSP